MIEKEADSRAEFRRSQRRIETDDGADAVAECVEFQLLGDRRDCAEIITKHQVRIENKLERRHVRIQHVNDKQLPTPAVVFLQSEERCISAKAELFRKRERLIGKTECHFRAERVPAQDCEIRFVINPDFIECNFAPDIF